MSFSPVKNPFPGETDRANGASGNAHKITIVVKNAESEKKKNATPAYMCSMN